MSLNRKRTILIIALIGSVSAIGLVFFLFWDFNKNSNILLITNPLENADLNVENISLLSASNNSVRINLTVSVSNPSGISATLNPSNIIIDYIGIDMGTTQLNTAYIGGGSTQINQELNVTITNTTHFDKFIEDFINNSSLNLTARGTVSLSAFGFKLSLSVSETIPLNGLNNNFNVTLTNFAILDANSTAVNVTLITEIKNPSSLTINLENLAFNVSWDSITIGELHVYNLLIMNGTNNSTNNATLILTNQTHFDKMAEDLLNGSDIELELLGLSSHTILDSYFDGLLLNVTMAGLAPFEVAIISVGLVGNSNESVTLDVELEIYNPTSGPIAIDNVTFNVSYLNEDLGMVNFSNLNVESGRKKYLLTVEFILTNLTLLSDLLTNYLNGIDVSLTFTGNSNGGNVIADIIDGYQHNITLPASSAFDYEIENLALVNATDDTLTLNATLIVNNTTPLNVSLDYLLLNVSYGGELVGNVTAGPVNLTIGNNSIPIQVIITGEYNMTAVEDLLSKHVNKQTVNLTLTGNVSTILDGMQDTLNTTLNYTLELEGVQNDLVDSIKVTKITLTIDIFGGAGGVEFEVNASVNNPFNFTINVTYIEYDVSYNDSDGCQIQLPPLWNRPYGNPRYYGNEWSITDNHTTSPIQLDPMENKELNATTTSNDFELCCRLYDDYYNDHDLVLDIDNGRMKVAIGDFTVWIDFEFKNVPVN
ncbi:MAG: DUF3712 domain-containing protein [Candidatus Helarchaeota archaeon]